MIVGRGVLLTALALVFAICLWLAPEDLWAIVIALVSSVLMMVVDTRYGLIVGISGIVIALLVWALGNDGWRTTMPVCASGRTRSK